VDTPDRIADGLLAAAASREHDTHTHTQHLTEDRGKWRKYAHGVANHRIEDG